MHKHFSVGLAAFVVAIALASAASTPGTAAPYEATIKACDNDNQRKPGSCKKEEKQVGVLRGCAGDACFVCPTDGRRKCYPASDSAAGHVLRANLPVPLAADGVNVEAVVKGCDYIHEHGQACDYKIDTLAVTEGSTGGSSFQCINKKECHKVK